MRLDTLKYFKKRPIEAIIFLIIFLYNYLFFLGWIFVLIVLFEDNILGMKSFIPNSLWMFFLFAGTFLFDLFFSLLAVTIYMKIKRKWLFWIIYLLIVIIFSYVTGTLLAEGFGKL
ncbi:MAG: hypothetical protein A3A02_00355 [Candidatus Buchananbacteria bacterium RIFCSPLOWO2_01_FULL_39_33]|uniref:Uncharacterized protein n=1 Tax=Candidatus Buchananbacteria bacterium RIFCSPLOWO2_01_FULL_39_33 TaxID=1797543 RepID=A0A1G1YKR2_9BACT|nr:MAG: hypothetical protein A3A02_00355 [Candidatus Buchananbacteria bacterium RIFCSPLOWO2_01_FULL_39_33]